MERETVWLNQHQMADLRRTVGILEQTLASRAIGEDKARGLLQVITDYAYAYTAKAALSALPTMPWSPSP